MPGHGLYAEAQGRYEDVCTSVVLNCLSCTPSKHPIACTTNVAFFYDYFVFRDFVGWFGHLPL